MTTFPRWPLLKCLLQAVFVEIIVELYIHTTSTEYFIVASINMLFLVPESWGCRFVLDVVCRCISDIINISAIHFCTDWVTSKVEDEHSLVSGCLLHLPLCWTAEEWQYNLCSACSSSLDCVQSHFLFKGLTQVSETRIGFWYERYMCVSVYVEFLEKEVKIGLQKYIKI